MYPDEGSARADMKPLRTCKWCGLEAYNEEDLKLFTKGKTSKYGRLNRCNTCEPEYKRRWREANPEKSKRISRKYYENNREKMRETRIRWSKENPERLKELSRKWRKANPFRRILTHAKAFSKKKNLPFDLDLKYLKQLWIECNGVCPMTGVPMLKTSDKVQDPYLVSKDRIIPEKGYVKGNVRLVCWWYNHARNNYGDELTLEMSQRVIDTAHELSSSLGC